jgi:hypothetical protein
MNKPRQKTRGNYWSKTSFSFNNKPGKVKKIDYRVRALLHLPQPMIDAGGRQVRDI